jgi:sugar phosphate isomerase/epimerase
MKVSMDYYTFISRDKWSLWWYLNECDEMNLDGAHIPDCDVTYPHELFTSHRCRAEWKYQPLPEETVLKIRDFCDERKWEKVLSGWGGPYASERTEDCLYLTQANLETASLLGAKVMRIVPSGYRDDPRRFKIEWAVRNLKRAAELAKSYDIVLGLETHAVISGASDIIEIIDRVDSDYLGVTLDTGNITTSSAEDPNVPPLKAIETLAPKIVATHIRDVTYDRAARAWRCVPCGEGIVDFKAIASILKDADYNGTLALEFINNNLNRAKEDLEKVKPIIRSCVEYLRKL